MFSTSSPKSSFTCRVALGSLLAFASIGWAQKSHRAPGNANQLFVRAQKLFSTHNYLEAADLIGQAYELDPTKHDYLYARGQALRLAGNCDAAITVYQQYLDTHPEAKQSDLAQQNIDRCRAQITETPAKPEINEPVVAPPPPPAEVSVAASAPAPAKRQPIYKKWWFWTTLGVVAVGVGVGVGLGVGLTSKNNFATLPDVGPGVTPQALQVRF